jgi:hypothetical protein
MRDGCALAHGVLAVRRRASVGALSGTKGGPGSTP